MKTAALSLAVGVLLGGAALVATASADDMAPTTMPAMPSTQPTASAIFNKTCPVSGDPVDPKAPTAQYQGKTIGFCCSDCIKEFQKNPDKYADKIK